MAKQQKIIVLGSTGMLGWVVADYLKKNTVFNVETLARPNFDAESFSEADKNLFAGTNYVINCVGIIKPYCKDNDAQGVQRAINVNARFPWILATATQGTTTKVIQIATDCVYSGSKGKYVESDLHDALDVYGKTKSLGEVFNADNFLNIRCSIIGPEKKGKLSLLEWFLAQPEGSELNGFSHHIWNGVTTLQFAELCEKIILKDAFTSIRAMAALHHFVPNNSVNKFELLNTIAAVYGRKYTIKDVNNIGPMVDRSLASKLTVLAEIYGHKTIEQALTEIKAFSY